MQPTIRAGDRFGKLVVLRLFEVRKGERVWECQCDCRRITYRVTAKLHKSIGCGCMRGRDFSHGMTNCPEFTTWQGMKARCLNKNSAMYKHYGGRGITVCPEWLGRRGFARFFADVGWRPSAKHSLDRIDPNGNYEPGNVRWATPEEQQRNRRNNRWLTKDGQTKVLVEWEGILGIDRTTISTRLRRGMSDEEALSLPKRRYPNQRRNQKSPTR